MIGRAASPAVIAEMFEYMRKHGLTLADLTELGGEDLHHPDPIIIKKARAVERTWERMAAAGLRFVDLEQFASEPANFRRYLKHQKNQSLGGRPSGGRFRSNLQQNQTLKNLPPSYCANGPSEPALGTAASANSSPEPFLESVDALLKEETTS